MQTLSVVLLGLLAACAYAVQPKTYHGYQVIRVHVSTRDQAKYLSELESAGHFELWNDIPIGGHVDVMIAPEKAHIAQIFTSLKMEHSVRIHDVQTLIDLEAKTMAEISQRKAMDRRFRQFDMDWENYHPLEVFYEYFDHLEANYPDVTTEVIGQSYEQRDLRLIKICRGGCGNKPAMFVEGGIHAREWIAPAVVMYFVRELTENLTPENDDLVANLDWYILPSVNPDGYAFTQNGDRLWRKTRSDTQSPLGCLGADPNRNWAFHWGEAGTSDNKCAETYHGLSAFSEIEVVSVSNFISANKDQIKFFNDVHSYSQYILLPWGHENNEQPPDQDDRRALAIRANEALRAVHGTAYTVGSILELLYPAAGGSLDWTLGVEGVKYSIAMELRDTGRYGFELPPSEIIPTSEEAWAFHMSAARDVIAEFGKKN